MESTNPTSAQHITDEHADSAKTRRATLLDIFRQFDEAGGADFELDQNVRSAEIREPFDWNEL